MRTVASLLLVCVVLFCGILAWAMVGELVRSTQDAVSSLHNLNGIGIPLAASPGASPAAVAAAASPVPSAEAARPVAAATIPAASEPPPTARPEATIASVTATPSPEPAPTPAQPTPVPSPAGRNPWVLLPSPEPGSRIPPGRAVIEARGRGEAPIREMRLELDGNTLPVAVDQRSESIWRAQATVNLPPGPHQARAVVVDADGRSGGYRWSFEALP